MKRTYLTIGVIVLVLLAGCSALQPGEQTQANNNYEPLTNASEAHLEAESVTIESTTEQRIQVQNNSTTVETVTRQNTTEIHNFSTERFHMNGSVYRNAGDAGAATFPSESYYADGTLYRKVVTQNGTVWQSQSAEYTRDMVIDFDGLTNETTLEYFTVQNNTEENGTYVYTADLTNETVFNTVIEGNKNRLASDSYQFLVENADEFTLTIIVDSKSEEIERISVALDSTVTGEQVRQSDAFNFSDQAELDNVEIKMSFSITKEYSAYNNGQTITIPEKVTNETTN